VTAFCLLSEPAAGQRLLDLPVRTWAGADAVATGAVAAFWNPAGAGILTRRGEVLVVDVLAPEPTGMGGFALAAAWQVDSATTVALGYHHVGVDGILRTRSAWVRRWHGLPARCAVLRRDDGPVGGARQCLAGAFTLTTPEPARVERSTTARSSTCGGCPDGELVESVLIPSPDRLTLCMSSQAGCAMACVFCATGWSGYRRQLTRARSSRSTAARAGGRGARSGLDHERGVHGNGRAADEPAAVMPALTLLNHAYGLGASRITVSTVGIVPGILELAERPEQFRLALSLHAPNEELRQQLVPLEKKYPLPTLMASARPLRGGRRTSHHVRVRDDRGRQRRARARASSWPAWSAVPGPREPDSVQSDSRDRTGGRRRPSGCARSRRPGIARRARDRPQPRGRDIAAACGQLRADHETNPPKPYLTGQLHAAGR
jgi:23S rRNA (adenine2503-C2)-methyltransferase